MNKESSRLQLLDSRTTPYPGDSVWLQIGFTVGRVEHLELPWRECAVNGITCRIERDVVVQVRQAAAVVDVLCLGDGLVVASNVQAGVGEDLESNLAVSMVLIEAAGNLDQERGGDTTHSPVNFVRTNIS